MKQVWLIDDDHHILDAMRVMVKMLGYEPRVFSSAREAGQLMMTGDVPDLLFLDLNMPEVSGMEFLKFVRSRDVWKTIPILMLTSESSDVSVETAVRLGADGYVFKPVNFEELQIALRTAVEKRRIKTGPLSPPTQPIQRK